MAQIGMANPITPLQSPFDFSANQKSSSGGLEWTYATPGALSDWQMRNASGVNPMPIESNPAYGLYSYSPDVLRGMGYTGAMPSFGGNDVSGGGGTKPDELLNWLTQQGYTYGTGIGDAGMFGQIFDTYGKPVGPQQGLSRLSDNGLMAAAALGLGGFGALAAGGGAGTVGVGGGGAASTPLPSAAAMQVTGTTGLVTPEIASMAAGFTPVAPGLPSGLGAAVGAGSSALAGSMGGEASANNPSAYVPGETGIGEPGQVSSGTPSTLPNLPGGLGSLLSQIVSPGFLGTAGQLLGGAGNVLGGIYGLSQTNQDRKLPSFEDFKASGMYKAGEDAVTREMASKGYLNSGNILDALSRNAQGAYANYVNLLTGREANAGNVASTQLSNAGLLTSGLPGLLESLSRAFGGSPAAAGIGASGSLGAPDVSSIWGG